jgi:hypothetical protein
MRNTIVPTRSQISSGSGQLREIWSKKRDEWDMREKQQEKEVTWAARDGERVEEVMEYCEGVLIAPLCGEEVTHGAQGPEVQHHGEEHTASEGPSTQGN